MKEVNVLKRLDHPNIIKYHDYFIFESYLYIVMEYCEKGDLHTVTLSFIDSFFQKRKKNKNTLVKNKFGKFVSSS